MPLCKERSKREFCVGGDGFVKVLCLRQKGRSTVEEIVCSWEKKKLNKGRMSVVIG